MAEHIPDPNNGQFIDSPLADPATASWSRAHAYWRQHLADWTPVIDLPMRPGPAMGGRLHQHRFDVPAALLAALPNDQPLVTILCAAFLTLLQRYSHQRDLLLGVRAPSAQGDLAARYLPLRLIITDHEPWSSLAQRLAAIHANNLAHADLPAEHLAALLRAGLDDHAGPLLPASFDLHSASATEQEPASTDQPADLSLHLRPANDGLAGTLSYNPARFDPAMIAGMARHYLRLLAAIATAPATPISRLPLLAETERQRILVDWNATAAPGNPQLCVHQIIERQAGRTPQASAVSGAGRELSYAELERQANQLAHYLRAQGVGPEQRVGICLERSPELVVALLAILKAGGAYVPLDPTYPRERLHLMLEDSGVLALITQAAHAPLAAAASGPAVRLLVLEQLAPELSRQPSQPPANVAQPANAAYMIYTSGSTGRPKGVVIEHRSLANFTEQAVKHYAMGTADRVLQCSSISWDTSAEEIYPTLASGGTLMLRTPDMLDSVRGFLDQCRAWRLTVLNLASAFWHELMIDDARAEINQLATLRLVIIGGERANPERVALWQQQINPRIRLLNTYGASEATAITTTHDLTAHRAAGPFHEVPIGRPFPNIQTYVLDEQLQPVPCGVLGTLYIGGQGLGRGYHGDPRLTAAKFIPHPWSAEPGARLYCTGDVACYREDGAIEYFGRRDHQVKIRGHRIALGEIEAVLSQHPLLRDVVLLAREDQPGRQFLAAYVVAQPDAVLDLAELRGFLASRLPSYMLPSAFVELATLPLTPNGKIDRRALPRPQLADKGSSAAELPADDSPTERALAALWRDVLGCQRFDRAASFFELGGQSLLAMHLIAKLRETFGRQISLQELLAYPTLGELAQLIDGTLTPTSPASIDFAAEIHLDPTISFNGPPPARLERVLLTGATGFLGAFLLVELARQTTAEIYCLVRAPSPAAASQRIHASLASYGLWDASLASRIRPVAGDLALPLLGLTAAAFDQLAANIDSIYHNGAAVNFAYPYAALKAANVLGTHEIIRLAGRGKLKPLHFISTLAVAEAGSADAPMIMEDTPLSSVASDSGYVQSKWVAERLVMLARQRGLPASIYRPDRIAGHSRSGASNSDDFFFRLLAGCYVMQTAPELDLHERMLPVDYVSQALVYLSLQPATLGQAFHFFHEQPLPFKAASAAIAANGQPIATLPYAEWRRRLLATATPAHPLYAFLSLFAEDPAELDGVGYQTSQPVSNRTTTQALRNSGMSCPPLDARLLQTYVQQIARQFGPEMTRAVGD